MSKPGKLQTFLFLRPTLGILLTAMFLFGGWLAWKDMAKEAIHNLPTEVEKPTVTQTQVDDTPVMRMQSGHVVYLHEIAEVRRDLERETSRAALSWRGVAGRFSRRSISRSRSCPVSIPSA
ncbi:MAG: hypothetical protein PVG22_11550 [Chromatiales bacterium]|jgi:hypothetical protein